MNFSKRSRWPVETNAISQLVLAKSKKGQTVIDLTESNPTRCDFNYLTTELLKPLMGAENLHYEPDPRGVLQTREAICRYYADKNIELSPEQIFLTANTSEAYSFLFRLLCDGHDSIVVPSPSYPLLDYLAALSDVNVQKYAIHYKNGWHLDTEKLKVLVAKEKPRAMVLVNPNNPTGNFIKADEVREVNQICTRFGCALIVDEVFLDFEFLGKKNISKSLAGNREALTFTLSGVSKILGLPQMKLSWIVVSGPEDLRQEVYRRLEVIADTFLSVNTPSQTAFGAWLGAREKIQKEILSRLSQNRAFLMDEFQNSLELRVLDTEGGWYAVLKGTKGAERSFQSDEALAVHLLEEKNVLIHPGYLFDFDGDDFLVISLLPQTGLFQEGIQGLKKIIDS